MKNINKIITLSTILFVTACGGSKEEKKAQTSTAKEKVENIDESKTENESATKETQVKEVVEINLMAKGDDMSAIEFDPKVLSVPANSRIKLTLENKSSAAGMLHNFVLVELGSGQEIAAAGIKAGKEKEFIPNDKRVIAHTALSNMGETVTVEFDAPAKGSYHYICTYPGHTSMIGRLNVE